MKFFLIFLALGIFRLLSLWIIILPKKLIRWEAAGNCSGPGLCRSWGESGKDAAGDGDSMPSSRRWLPLEGEGELRQAGNLKQSVGGSGEAKFLKVLLLLVGKNGEVDLQDPAFLSQQELGS